MVTIATPRIILVIHITKCKDYFKIRHFHRIQFGNSNILHGFTLWYIGAIIAANKQVSQKLPVKFQSTTSQNIGLAGRNDSWASRHSKFKPCRLLKI